MTTVSPHSNNQSAIIRALEDSRYQWRTIQGLAFDPWLTYCKAQASEHFVLGYSVA